MEGDDEQWMAPPPAAPMNKKGWRVQAWVLVDPTGQVRVIEQVGKHAIKKRTGIPTRDLRILEPSLSHPSRILGRETAIVINLEHIKAIITAQQVMFLNFKHPLVAPFIENLRQIFSHRHAISSSWEAGGDLCSLNEPHSSPGESCDGCSDDEKEHRNNMSEHSNNPQKLLPFEFVALEACLQCVCVSLDREAKALELEAHPALDKLVSKISSPNIDLVRNIKARLVSLTGRVQKVRDELEHLLDDDDDMAAMYLTDKLKQSHSNILNYITDGDDDDDEVEEEEEEARGDKEKNVVDEGNARDAASSKHHDVQGLEMILEAYFVQIQGTLQTLTSLREYVDDTEDYINIILDDRQNSLLRVGILVSTGTMLAGANVALSGLFAMNIKIGLYDSAKSGMPNFLGLVIGSTVASIALFVILVAFYKHKRLL